MFLGFCKCMLVGFVLCLNFGKFSAIIFSNTACILFSFMYIFPEFLLYTLDLFTIPHISLTLFFLFGFVWFGLVCLFFNYRNSKEKFLQKKWRDSQVTCFSLASGGKECSIFSSTPICLPVTLYYHYTQCKISQAFSQGQCWITL